MLRAAPGRGSPDHPTLIWVRWGACGWFKAQEETDPSSLQVTKEEGSPGATATPRIGA